MRVGQVSIRMTSPIHIEAYRDDGLECYAECKALLTSDAVIVDWISTKAEHRRKGYATEILNALVDVFNRHVGCFAPLPEASQFWDAWFAVHCQPGQPGYQGEQ